MGGKQKAGDPQRWEQKGSRGGPRGDTDLSAGWRALCWHWACRAGRAGIERLEAGTVSEEPGLAKSGLRGVSDGERQARMGASRRLLEKAVPAYIRNCKTESQDAHRAWSAVSSVS